MAIHYVFPSIPMPQKKYLYLLFLLFMIRGFTAPLAAMAEEVKFRSSVMVVISQDIKPYLEAFAGMRDYLDGKGIPVVKRFHKDLVVMRAEEMTAFLSENHIEDCIAIGPEAVNHLFGERRPPGIHMAYTMVFDVESIVPGSGNACGVPLKMPADLQIKAIRTHLPTVKRIGVMYDPSLNSEFVTEATQYAEQEGARIVRMETASEKEISAVLKQSMSMIDAIWLIPDLTVISEKIVPYIIKEAMGNGIPVVGYNRFFHESGAALSFILDYREMGKQTAFLVHERMAGNPCGKKPPFFRTLLNARLLDKLGVTSVKPGNE
jgi:putative ABC transport system substrate-binding protein